MNSTIRRILSASLAVLVAAAGVGFAFQFRRSSIALLGFTAFLAAVSPLIAGLPAALATCKSRVVFVILLLPVAAFGVTKSLLRLAGNSDEPLGMLLMVFLVAVMVSAVISWPISRLHATRALPIARRTPLLASLYGSAICSIAVWLSIRGSVPPNFFYLGLVGLGVSFLISFIPGRASTSGTDDLPTG